MGTSNRPPHIYKTTLLYCTAFWISWPQTHGSCVHRRARTWTKYVQVDLCRQVSTSSDFPPGWDVCIVVTYLILQVHSLVFLLLRARSLHRAALSAAERHERKVGAAEPTTLTTPTLRARQVASRKRACRSAFMFAPWTRLESNKTITNDSQALSERRAILSCRYFPTLSSKPVSFPAKSALGALGGCGTGINSKYGGMSFGSYVQGVPPIWTSLFSWLHCAVCGRMPREPWPA